MTLSRQKDNAVFRTLYVLMIFFTLKLLLNHIHPIDFNHLFLKIRPELGKKIIILVETSSGCDTITSLGLSLYLT